MSGLVPRAVSVACTCMVLVVVSTSTARANDRFNFASSFRTFGSAGSARAISQGDFNNDGLEDIVVANDGEFIVSVFLAGSQQSFDDRHDVALGQDAKCAEAGIIPK